MILPVVAASFVCGVALALWVDIPSPAAVALLLLGATMALPLLLSVRRSPIPAVACVALLLGVLRVQLSGEDPAAALNAYHERDSTQVEGVVAEDPVKSGAVSQFVLEVVGIDDREGRQEVSGSVLVTHSRAASLESAPKGREIRYGDLLRLDGRLEPPPELPEFDYPAFLARQGIGTVISFPDVTLLEAGRAPLHLRAVHGFRQRFAASLERVLMEPQASMGKAMLLGIRDDIPEDVLEEFRVTGASHVLAISGLHVGTLLVMSLGLSAWVLGRRRHLYLLAPLALIWLYALVSGMSPSVTRASIMGSVYLAALLLGRPRSVLPALGVAAAVMVAVEPMVVASVSFQLSFAAMAGIALMAEPMGRWLQSAAAERLGWVGVPETALKGLSFTTAMTVAATVATLPLVAFYFQRVSLVGVPATALVLPALPAVLVTQAAAGLVGMVHTTLAQPLAWLAWLATFYVTEVVGAMARLPIASVETGRIAHALVFAYYGALAGIYAAVVRRDSLAHWARDLGGTASSLPRAADVEPKWLLPPAVAAGAIVWAAALTMHAGQLEVSFLDVGQGDAAFIETPGGHQILVDGGPDGDLMMRLIGERMPFMDRTLELVVLTHGHSDHVSGLTEALRRFEVERVVHRMTDLEGHAYDAWHIAVEREGAEVLEARRGQSITTDDGVLIQVVGPPETLLRGTASDVDNASVVVRLVYGNVSFLLTGDMFAEGERALAASGTSIDSDVLKVGHHGSRSSSSEAFLAAVSPAIAVISAGEGNGFGHPHAETLEALRRWVPDAGLLVTKDSGTLKVSTDGERLWVGTER